jgi:hypothetical protein
VSAERSALRYTGIFNHMSKQQYSGYIALIFKGDDVPSAAGRGDAMAANFPGADYELVEGAPCGVCSSVQGDQDRKVCCQIQDWINSHG